MKALLILFVVLFTALLAFVQGLQAKDRRQHQMHYDAKLSKLWHYAQGCLHLLVAWMVFIAALPSLFSSIFGFVMTLAIIWLEFDLLNNLVSGNSPFYKGQSSFMDRLLSRVPVAVEVIVKLILILVATTFFLTNPFGS